MTLKKRLFAIVLAIALIASFIPGMAFAVEPDPTDVTVYFTLAYDGDIVKANTTGSPAIARIPVTVPYTALSTFNPSLAQYNRFESDGFENGGSYVNTTVVSWPTVLHLFLQAVKDYNLNGAVVAPGVTPANPFSTLKNNASFTLTGRAISPSGSPTSLWFENMWGHGGNLLYYVNNAYPLMAGGWGATADYIMLQDGMEISIGLFNDYSFWGSGYFAFFDVAAKAVAPGATVNFSALGSSTDGVMGGSVVPPVPLNSLKIAVYNSAWVQQGTTFNTAGDGTFSYTFPSTPGTYYVVGYDPYAGDRYSANIVPAVSTITVTDSIPANTAPQVRSGYPLHPQGDPLTGNVDDAVFYNLAAMFVDTDTIPARQRLQYSVVVRENGQQILSQQITGASWSFVPPDEKMYELAFTASDGSASVTASEWINADPSTSQRPEIKSTVTNPDNGGTVIVGKVHGIDMTEIFRDPNNGAFGPMTYEVSVNGGMYNEVPPAGTPNTPDGSWNGSTYNFKPRGVHFFPSGLGEYNDPVDVIDYTLRFRATVDGKTSLVYEITFDTKRYVGDVDGDGFITGFDGMLVSELFFAGTLDTLAPLQYIAADVDGSGSVTVTDAIMILDYANGDRYDFPAGEFVIPPAQN